MSILRNLETKLLHQTYIGDGHLKPSVADIELFNEYYLTFIDLDEAKYTSIKRWFEHVAALIASGFKLLNDEEKKQKPKEIGYTPLLKMPRVDGKKKNRLVPL